MERDLARKPLGDINSAYTPSVSSELPQRPVDASSNAASCSDSSANPKGTSGASEGSNRPVPAPRSAPSDGNATVRSEKSNKSAVIETVSERV